MNTLANDTITDRNFMRTQTKQTKNKGRGTPIPESSCERTCHDQQQQKLVKSSVIAMTRHHLLSQYKGDSRFIKSRLLMTIRGKTTSKTSVSKKPK